MTSSGSEVSANAVKQRRSRKTTTISRRWLLSGSSAPPWTIASARAGEKKRLSPREPLELRHLLAHPLLERAVQLRQLVVEALDPQQGAHARQDLRLVDRLGEEVVGARLDALHALLSGVERGDHHHRQHRRPRWHRRCSPLGFMSTRAAS